MDGERVEGTGFLVRAGSHEGPFELILDLVDRRRLSVSELSLAQVTDEYIAYVRGHDAFPMEEAARFIGVAATLLLIKSKSLIPELELSTEEEEDVTDLTERLARYEAIRTAGKALAAIAGRARTYAAGQRPVRVSFAPGSVTASSLAEALDALLAEEEAAALPEARVRPTISLEEVMSRMRERVTRAQALSFSSFSGGSAERVEVIVSFLALLELMREGAVDAEQRGAFGDIRITNKAPAIPRY